MKDMQEELKELLAERAIWEHTMKDFKGEKRVWERTAISLKTEKGRWEPTKKGPQMEKGTWEPMPMGTAEQIGQSETESKANDEPQRDPIRVIEDFEATGNRVFHKGETLDKLLNPSVKAVKVMEEDQMKLIRKIYKNDQGK